MTIRLDKVSHDRGFRDGNGNKISLSQQEFTLAGFDALSYLSGFLDGKARGTIADSMGVAKYGQAGWEGKGLGCA